MYIYVYTYIYIHTYIYTHTYIWTNACTCILLFSHIKRTHVCMRLCMCAPMHEISSVIARSVFACKKSESVRDPSTFDNLTPTRNLLIWMHITRRRGSIQEHICKTQDEPYDFRYDLRYPWKKSEKI